MSHGIIFVIVACVSFLAPKVSSAPEQKCRIVLHGSMLSCFNAREEDLPKTNQPHVDLIAISKSTIPHLKASSLKFFPKLTDFHGENSGIEKIDENAFQFNLQINWIDISLNRISNIGPNLIKGFQKIERLNLSGNHDLVFPEKKPFLISEKLKWLNLEDCNIKRVHSASFEHLPALEYLILRGNELRTLPEDIFRKNSGLLVLNIADNKFSYLSGKVFLPLRTITAHFEGNPWDCGCHLTPLLLWSKRNIMGGSVKCEKPRDLLWKDIEKPLPC